MVGMGELVRSPRGQPAARLAAEQGYAAAQFNLGVMYASGQGVPEDDVTAYAWLNIAAAQGQSSDLTFQLTRSYSSLICAI